MKKLLFVLLLSLSAGYATAFGADPRIIHIKSTSRFQTLRIKSQYGVYNQYGRYDHPNITAPSRGSYPSSSRSNYSRSNQYYDYSQPSLLNPYSRANDYGRYSYRD